MDSMTYITHLFTYGLLLLAVVGIPLILAQGLLDWLGPSPWRFAVYPVVAVLYLGLFVVGWMSHNAARRRALEGEGFWEAVSSAYDEGLLYLSGVPLLGSFLYSSMFRRGKTSADHDDRFDDPNVP